jgi:hypothetical protein
MFSRPSRREHVTATAACLVGASVNRVPGRGKVPASIRAIPGYTTRSATHLVRCCGNPVDKKGEHQVQDGEARTCTKELLTNNDNQRGVR